MNGSGSVLLSGSIEQVWSKILDPNVLAKCIIGCESMEPLEDNKYHANISIGIAAVKGKYDAIIQLADIKPHEGYKLIVHGEGAPGHVDAEGVIELTESDGKTTLTYSYTAAAGGKIAGIGQRMLGGVAKLIIGDFFKRLKKEIELSERSA
ncbi:SRPBCC family protein [Alicyclobacillus dauci]|uniref:Carbon monoxide dehydrogenase subunit G n=1 Tax=Alicyclobacillus dauci TaxID=1475485 RepID=A0ABY6Z576_9BACL|nr:carbon monoxide dehydrogenase subunit G [Alicyclobacillus dauci]WAH38011.1 carbon monoxide dehydrogenase subunit G [Alicyclobacillus dauci]